MGVFAPARGGTLVEGELDPAPKATAYERSKVAAQREADEAAARGLDVVSLNPAAVYGPAPIVSGVNVFLARLLARRMPVLPPGGFSLVWAEGVAEAHVAAADRRPAGERYLLG